MFLSQQMTRVFIFFTFMILFIGNFLALDMSRCSTWDLDHDSVNNLDASVSLWEKNNCPNMDCAILCDREATCRSFFHHPSLQKCLASSSYKRGLPVNKVTEQGWNYYTKKQHCDQGYIFNQSLRVCYKFYAAKKTFNDAMITCEAEGAKLMTIRNKDEFMFILQVMKEALATSIFLGLRAVGANREWKWWNGQATSYFNWAVGMPDNYFGIESCVEVKNNLYNDIPCSNLLYFVCQRFT